MQERQINSSTG